MAKTEDIEAKLAAYVDGEIDQAGRAEIEKHLASHAQHRQLIKELMAQRDLLRGMPREVAPLEVSESVNASLERAVLLGDVDGESDSGAMQIRPWSQFRAIAAILFFTASLAAVIYYLLPSPNHKPELAADIRQSNALSIDRESTPDAAKQPTTVPLAFSTSASDLIAAAPTTRPGATPTLTEQQIRTAVALRDIGQGGGVISRTNSEPMFPLTNSVSNVASNGGLDRAMFENMATVTPPQPLVNVAVAPPSQVVVVLASANPEQASREVTQYLTRANIAWETPAEPMPAPLDIRMQTQQAVASRLQAQSYQLKSAEPTTQVAQLAIADNLSPATTIPTESQDSNRNGFPGSAGSNRIGAGDRLNGGFGGRGGGGAGRGGRGAGAGALSIDAAVLASPERRIIARKLSRQQAAEVQLALNAMRSKGIPDSQSALAAPTTTVSLNGFANRDDFVDRQTRALAQDVEKQLGTTMPAEMRAEASATTLPAQATTQPLVVAGAPTTTPAEVVAIPQFDPRSINFSLAPIQTPSIDFRAPTTAESSVGTLSIAHAPVLAPSTQPAEELVDVIIVVQSASIASPATAPAAAPSVP